MKRKGVRFMPRRLSDPVQNLQVAGCQAKLMQQYVARYQSGRIKDVLCLFHPPRRVRLDKIHAKALISTRLNRLVCYLEREEQL